MNDSRREGARNFSARALLCAALALVLLAGLHSPGARSPSRPLLPVRLALHWNHQSQFAGYYMALQKGFYERRGLQVTLLRGGPDQEPVERMRRGEADAATTFLTGALLARNRGVPIVHLAQVVNRSGLLLISWKGKGISKIEDLDGRRVSLWGDQWNTPYLALFAARGIRPKIVPQNYSAELFLRGGVDACSAMHYNEYHTLVQSGVDPEEMTLFFLKDYGLGVPEDGIYALEPFYRQHPDACRALAEASLEGWAAADETPEEALALVMDYARGAHVPTNAAHMRWMLQTILPTIFPGPGDSWKLGELPRAEYERTAALLAARGLIREAPPFEAFRGQGSGRAP